MANYGSTTDKTGLGETVSPVQQFTGPGDMERLSDEELIRRSCADPPDREAFEVLSKRCLSKIWLFARWKCSLCPVSFSEDLFCDAVASRATNAFVESICTFRFEGSFLGWLYKVVENAAITEQRKLMGRGSLPRRIESIDIREEDTDANAGTRHLSRELTSEDLYYRSKYWASPFEHARDAELSDIVISLLTLHGQKSERDRKSAEAIKQRQWNGCTAREIAEIVDTTAGYVDQLVSHDYEKLKELFEKRFGTTDIGRV